MPPVGFEPTISAGERQGRSPRIYDISRLRVKISNAFAALENLSDSKDINRGWENIKENIKKPQLKSLGLHEMKQHKPCFDEECL